MVAPESGFHSETTLPPDPKPRRPCESIILAVGLLAVFIGLLICLRQFCVEKPPPIRDAFRWLSMGGDSDEGHERAGGPKFSCRECHD